MGDRRKVIWYCASKTLYAKVLLGGFTPGMLRRNHQHLIPLHTSPQKETLEPAPEQAPMPSPMVPTVLPTKTSPLRTRYGRAVVKPERLNL
ncbi:hypothetical protein DAT39_021271 [Clarias magur]|uniref:Uncharacterized protein n=1 Tax=Clarias magur TaxID=1594786 RepID=A0A8J4T4W4_CLAMG|nr:hypothetical protein DAT39_021271 [Clarias magur]